MKNFKLKTLILSTLSTLLITSIPVTAETLPSLFYHSNSQPMVYVEPSVNSLSIVGYSDSIRFDRTSDYLSSFFRLNLDKLPNNIYHWANSKGAIAYIGTVQSGFGAGKPGTFLDGSDWSYNDFYFGGTIDTQMNIRSFSDIPDGYHTLKFVVVNPDFKATTSVITSSINLRVCRLSKHISNTILPVNSKLIIKLPKPIDPNTDLYNYVDVYFKDSGNKTAILPTLGADNQTLTITPITNKFIQNTNYELFISPGFRFADSTESFDGTIFDFTTSDKEELATTNFDISSELDKANILINSGNAKISDYNLFGINGITEINLADVNEYVQGKDNSTIANLQSNVTAIRLPMNHVNMGSKVISYYTALGATAVTSENVKPISSAIKNAVQLKGSNLTKTEIFKVINDTLIQINNSTIRINNGQGTLADYTLLDITKVTDFNLSDINEYVKGKDNTTNSKLQSNVTTVVTALNSINSGSSTVKYYTTLGITSVNASNIKSISKAVKNAAKLKGSNLSKSEILQVINSTR